VKSSRTKTPKVGRPVSHQKSPAEARTDDSSSSKTGRAVRESGRPALISENSALRVRTPGRPRSFEPFTLEKLRSLYPNVTTERGLQNKYFMARACATLRDDERFAWALKREMVLTELGRIASPNGIRYLAMKLVKNPPETTREAMGIIQSLRRTKGLREGALDLSIKIRQNIKHFRRENPDIRGWDVANALNMVLGGIKQRERNAARYS
jgi:hypothetical protein